MDGSYARARWVVGPRQAAPERRDNFSACSDGELVALALGGNSNAYGELVRRHQSSVYNAAYRMVGERQQALDLAQEAFIRAFTALDSFDCNRPFAPWIHQIVTNAALNFLRKNGPPTIPLDDPALEQSTADSLLADHSTEPERLLLAREHQETLRRAILALPPRYRAVIELRHFRELSYDEIAAALALPLSDVKSDLFRARQLLRAHLEK